MQNLLGGKAVGAAAAVHKNIADTQMYRHRIRRWSNARIHRADQVAENLEVAFVRRGPRIAARERCWPRGAVVFIDVGCPLISIGTLPRGAVVITRPANSNHVSEPVSIPASEQIIDRVFVRWNCRWWRWKW